MIRQAKTWTNHKTSPHTRNGLDTERQQNPGGTQSGGQRNRQGGLWGTGGSGKGKYGDVRGREWVSASGVPPLVDDS